MAAALSSVLASVLVLWSIAGCSGDPPESSTPAPEPGPLMVGVARTRMPVPLGIGTVGYGGFSVQADPTPFAEIYPGTKRIHDHPDFRAIAISRGPGFELILLRSDTVGVFQHLRRAVVLELEARLGRSVDDSLVIGATHTHSGPGRVIDVGGPFDLIADKFFPEFYLGIVDAMADTVEAALADLKPGRVGTTFTYTDEAHNDRRCEDGLTYTNGTLPIVAVEQEGEIVGVATAYAVHGTVLGIEDLTLSQDVHGAIEQAVEDRFDHPVLALSFNAWGADMSPADPAVPEQPGAVAQAGYDHLERAGAVIGDAVAAAIGDLAWDDAPDIASHTFRIELDREAIGYDADTFPYTYGGVYCSGPEDCDPATTVENLDHACLPFNEDYAAPPQTELTSGQLGAVSFVTFPGEPGTLLAEQILRDIGEDDVVFFGYAQDYSGYSILEDDWWQGGYEASGSLWGPRQGEYLADRVVDAFGWAHGGTAPPGPSPVVPFDASGFTPYAPTPGTGVGTVVTDVAATVGPTDEVVFVVDGEDPWFGAPLVTLVDAAGAPVLRPNGLPVTSDGQAFWVELTPEPSYADAPAAPTRAFHWAFHLPVDHVVVGATPQLTGAYRLSAALPGPDGASTTVQSGVFTVTR